MVCWNGVLRLSKIPSRFLLFFLKSTGVELQLEIQFESVSSYGWYSKIKKIIYGGKLQRTNTRHNAYHTSPSTLHKLLKYFTNGGYRTS